MTRLFPEAKDYKTVDLKISPAKLTAIESRSGTKVLPGQRENYQYFEMKNGKGETIGYTSAVTQKGEFGAIEFVFGLDKSYKIVSIYIQRSREKSNQFKDSTFLDSFVGKSVKEGARLTDPRGSKGDVGTRAVVSGLKKELVTFEELVLKK